MQTPFQHTVREVLVPTLSHGHGEGTRPDPVRSCGDAARTRVAGFVSASWRRRRRRRRRINLDATRHRLVIRPTNPTNIGRRLCRADAMRRVRAGNEIRLPSIQLTSEIFWPRRAAKFFEPIRHALLSFRSPHSTNVLRECATEVGADHRMM